ncbi:hypothetical protein ACF08N_24800 [Streptomyces sp. NPDC015127]|uniref:hypothetical protein n=1 Tax=Streptomyces sp. NPDC015127 TaxID=3364939 RepID=UPI0036FB77B6
MIRNVIGSILALAGATAAVWSPFRDWYDGRHGRDYRVQDLFNGITGTDGPLLTSVLLPLAFGALITLLGVLLRSRLLVALSGLIVLGFTVLWMVRQGQAAGSLTVGGDGAGLGTGVALVAGGGVLLLVAAVVMSGRRRREEEFDEETHRLPQEDWGPYGPDAGGPVPYDRGPHRSGPYDDGHGPEGPPTLPSPGQRDER